MRAIAVSGPRRIAVLPEVPTVVELGQRGFDVRFAFVLMAPRGTPAEAKRAWAGLVAETLSTPEARTRLDAWGGLEPPEAGGPEGTAAWIEQAHARWGQVARKAGMRPD
ncbi:tripartite tricarboxylate transporter substrate-binding protein [Siccirubricoccus deserti]